MSKLFNNILRSTHTPVWTFLGLTFLSVFILIRFVNIQPEVDNNFFFSNDDPQFQSENLISRLFVRTDTQLIISASGDISSQQYYDKVNDLTEMLDAVEGVSSVNSLTRGPSSLQDALDSPLWKRIIISHDRKSTNLIVLLDENKASEGVKKIENIINAFENPDFQLMISGLPYIVELIKRNLVGDLRIFSILAFLIFGIILFRIFQSKSILAGALISCLNACIWTFMGSDLLDVPIGILTANLGTIIFVLTLSHIIFLTYNWRKVCEEDQSEKAVEEAIKMTFPASFWSMVTTLIGFLSLLNVPAKPLRDLGMSGSVGTLIALATAYSIFPAFLKLTNKPGRSHTEIESWQTFIFRFLDQRRKYVATIIITACVLVIPGLWMVNSDPSLLKYFADDSEMARGLSYIDKNGGSSPLVIVVRHKDATKRLNHSAAYQKLWELQRGLEQHHAVGSVISLPVLMAQAKKSPIAFFMAWEWLLDILEQPQFDEIAKSFVTEDRKYGLFLLRMNEGNRKQSRLEIVDEIESIVETYKFHPEIFGGVYILQGHLAKLVAQSLVFGLGKLILMFAVIVLLISFSFRVSAAITISIALIPIGIIGLIGVYRIPLDIVAAPASNVAIAMGIDSMIHMTKAYRRFGDWQKVRQYLWQPIITSMFVVSIGFAIFLLSNFPPTQRFGAAIVYGTIFAALTALFIMPMIFEALTGLAGPDKALAKISDRFKKTVS